MGLLLTPLLPPSDEAVGDLGSGEAAECPELLLRDAQRSRAVLRARVLARIGDEDLERAK